MARSSHEAKLDESMVNDVSRRPFKTRFTETRLVFLEHIKDFIEAPYKNHPICEFVVEVGYCPSLHKR